MCFLVFGFCLVGCISRRDLSLSDNNSVPFGTYHQVQLLIYLSSVFPQSGFRLHSSFAEIFSRTEVVFIVVFSHFYGSKGIFLGILQSVDLLNMMQFMHINFEQIQTGHLFFVVVVQNIFKRHNFTDQLVS